MSIWWLCQSGMLWNLYNLVESINNFYLGYLIVRGLLFRKADVEMKASS